MQFRDNDIRKIVFYEFLNFAIRLHKKIPLDYIKAIAKDLTYVLSCTDGDKLDMIAYYSIFKIQEQYSNIPDEDIINLILRIAHDIDGLELTQSLDIDEEGYYRKGYINYTQLNLDDYNYIQYHYF